MDTQRETIKSLANENYSLREHIILLQSRLMEAQAEVPDLPPNIDLSQPRQDLLLQAAGITPGAPGTVPGAGAPQQGQHGGMNEDMNSLNRIAVAGLGMRKHPDETNFMNSNFAQQNKRVRTDDQGDGSDAVSKQEATHGLPLP